MRFLSKLNNTKTPFWIILAFPFIAIATLLVGDPYISHILIIGGIYGFLAIGLNIITGLCGQINLGMAGFYAIGSYSSALLTTKLGLNFWFAFIIAILFAGVAGLVIGYPALKVRGGVYLVLVTTSFASIIQTILTQWVKLTNGPMGVVGIGAPSIFGIKIVSLNQWIFFVAFLLLIAMILAMRIENSRVGRSLKAVRESDTSAQSLGVNISFYKIQAFIMSAAFGGAGGSLYAHYMTTISPDIYNMNLSVLALTMIVVGGVGSIPGSVLGALIIAILPELFRFMGIWQMAVYSLLIVLFTIFLPRGLIGGGIDSFLFFKTKLLGRE